MPLEYINYVQRPEADADYHHSNTGPGSHFGAKIRTAGRGTTRSVTWFTTRVAPPTGDLVQLTGDGFIWDYGRAQDMSTCARRQALVRRAIRGIR
jgi:hypothetical protein